jgi:hypothetical protein
MIGYIPIFATNHMVSSGIELNGRAMLDSVTNGVFFRKKEAVIKVDERPSGLYGMKWGILAIPEFLPERLYRTTLGDIHIIFTIFWMVPLFPKGCELQEYLKRTFFPAMIKAESYLTDIFSFEVLAPILTEIEWTESDISAGTERSFEALSDRVAKNVKDWKSPIPLPVERGLALSLFTRLVMLDVKPVNTPEEIGELFDAYQSLHAQLYSESVFHRTLHVIALSLALGFDLPVQVKFPTFLLADSWSRYEHGKDDQRSFFIENYKKFQEECAFMSERWQVRYDEALAQIFCRSPEIANQNPLEMNGSALSQFSCLFSVPNRLLYCRIQLFQAFGKYIPDLLMLVKFGNTETLLGQLLYGCRAAISTQFKLKKIEEMVSTQGSDHELVVKFNRWISRRFYSNPQDRGAKSLLRQFIEQIPVTQLAGIKRSQNPWKVKLIGEGATDMGGVGRDCFTEVCTEIMRPEVGLFIPSPDMRRDSGQGRDLLVPNPRPVLPQTFREKLYFYAGALMTCCYISKIPEPFRFARFVWNAITGRPVTIEDIYDVDGSFKDLMQSLENWKTGAGYFDKTFDLRFCCENSGGESVELFPGGSEARVTFDRRFEYVQKCQKFRVNEFSEHLGNLRKGFNFIMGKELAQMLSPWEMKLLLCGPDECPVDELKKCCTCDHDDATIQMLWRVLAKFTPHERMLFIRFGTGRMNLPPAGCSWGRDFRIWVDPNPSNFPTSATCSMVMKIPRYPSEEVMEERLRFAVANCITIERDNAAEMNELREWM